MRNYVVALAFVLLAAFVRVLPAGAATAPAPVLLPGVQNPSPGGGSTAPNGGANAVPVLTGMSPTSAPVTSTGFTLTLTGSNFSGSSTIEFGGLTLFPISSAPTQLSVVVPSSAMRNPGSIPVFVINPAPGGGASQAVSFTIAGTLNPPPSISAVSPTNINAGSPATNVTVTGTGFTGATAATLGGVPGTVSGNTIAFNLPAALIATPGILSGLVSNPLPGGGAASFTISLVALPPTVSAFAPTSARTGSAAAMIQVSGTNFRSGSTITFGGTPIPTTFVSPTSLEGTLAASFLQGSGNFPVGVMNPGPAGAPATGPGAFAITNALPVLTSVAPAQISAAALATTVILGGTGFAANSSATAGGTSLATAYVSATTLSVTIPPSLLKAGTLPITVANPAPGGGTSYALNLAVGNPIPIVTSVSPSSLTATQTNAVLTVTGNNFAPNAVIAVGGANLPTTFVSSTQLTAPLAPPLPLGKPAVTVTNPAPGGGSSSAVTIQISAVLPTIAGVTPASVTAGQTITVTGTNFGPGTLVLFNGTPIPTTAMSATQVSAAIPAAAAVGPASVVVENPAASASGALNSATSTIQIVNPVGPVAPVVSAISPSTVPVRTPATITVTGSNFSSGAQIGVGQQLITPATSSATTLTATVTMPAAGNVNVVVTNAGGLRSNTMTLTSLGPAPVIVNCDLHTGKAGSNVEIALVGQNFAGGAQLYFGGKLIAPTAASSTMLLVKLTLPAAGPAMLRVVNPGNQASNDVPFSVTQ
jgi:IPT/TIG domain